MDSFTFADIHVKLPESENFSENASWRPLWRISVLIVYTQVIELFDWECSS